MTGQIGVISLSGITDEDSQYPFLLAAGITTADIGKAVTMSATANTVQLASDDDRILGVLGTVEVRTVEGISIGMVALEGGFTFAVNPDATSSSPDQTPAVGDYLVGAQDNSSPTVKGYVQKLQAGNEQKDWLVVEVRDSGANVVAIKV